MPFNSRSQACSHRQKWPNKLIKDSENQNYIGSGHMVMEYESEKLFNFGL